MTHTKIALHVRFYYDFLNCIHRFIEFVVTNFKLQNQLGPFHFVSVEVHLFCIVGCVRSKKLGTNKMKGWFDSVIYQPPRVSEKYKFSRLTSISKVTSKWATIRVPFGRTKVTTRTMTVVSNLSIAELDLFFHRKRLTWIMVGK